MYHSVTRKSDESFRIKNLFQNQNNSEYEMSDSDKLFKRSDKLFKIVSRD